MLTPEIYAEKVYAIWEESLHKLNLLIGEKPEMTEELREKLMELKEETIQKLIVYGKQHSEMPDAERQSSCNRMVMKMGGMASNPNWANTMNECFKHYSAIDRTFSNEISKFNIITQYADFELLKKQAPAEAERLGLV